MTFDTTFRATATSAIARIWQGLRRLTGRRGNLRKVIFVSYGEFDCNSAVHIAGFANNLVRMGYRVAVAALGPPHKAYAIGRPMFECFDIADLGRSPDKVIGFDGHSHPEETMLYCWTPRPIVRAAIEPALDRYAIPYVVHLEDNEVHLAEVLGSTDKGNETWFDQFIARAAGVTVIEPRLMEMLPRSANTLLLEPGIDHRQFGQPLDPLRRQAIRATIGVPLDACMLVYPGNVHPANVDEMRPLYEAVQTLRQCGRSISLVRTGTDYVAADFLDQAHHDSGVISLGQVGRTFLIDLLRCADLFVQPGKPGPFNDYRLPSKIPEFLAVGRPLILPRTNVGRQLRHGQDALLLDEGSADEIARHIQTILSDPALARRLAANAKAFAQERYQWKRQTRKLENFLTGIDRSRSTSAA
jgi:glycosyltransferase involved in cell wall biosynthesis